MICERCYQSTEVGEHGQYKCPLEPRRGVAVIGDEIDEWNDNVAHEPVHFTSRAEKRRYLNARNLQPFVRHVDGDKHLSRWV